MKRHMDTLREHYKPQISYPFSDGGTFFCSRGLTFSELMGPGAGAAAGLPGWWPPINSPPATKTYEGAGPGTG